MTRGLLLLLLLLLCVMTAGTSVSGCDIDPGAVPWACDKDWRGVRYKDGDCEEKEVSACKCASGFYGRACEHFSRIFYLETEYAAAHDRAEALWAELRAEYQTRMKDHDVYMQADYERAEYQTRKRDHDIYTQADYERDS